MYLGVDESNHGRFPEIFVGCFSNSKQDIIEGQYQKKRSKSLKSRNLEKISYRHILFSSNQLEILDHPDPLIISVCEFAEFFNDFEEIKKIFIDGSVSDYQLEKMYEFLYKINKKTKIFFAPKMDQRIKLVNESDNWANHLHRYYSTKEQGKKRKYLDTLLTPKIEKYLKLF